MVTRAKNSNGIGGESEFPPGPLLGEVEYAPRRIVDVMDLMDGIDVDTFEWSHEKGVL